MLSPKRLTYRKRQRRSYCGLRENATRGNNISFGEFGLVAEAQKYLTARQIEAARVAMTRHLKRGGKVWIRIFPDVPYTKKPAETRMGKGKGNPEMWIAPVQRGTVLFEVAGVPADLARRAMELAASKLPVRARFVQKAHA
ncbi:50S ribosomal protein L16 [Candidatus Haliotispira prima]|uniref:Large ribosomal subunit protein uL16 n=1 Tax=Candidatus Haliotispira prima TaxID=3034016 RepID=A0ABY8MKB5_9SPIO|nr:50S ribosomal protein L16 [Candidatus Haliotispira prima]